jgi:hypothetical protein
LYGFFVGVHDGITTLEFEEYYLSESSLRESIEYDIVASLPNHILRCVWEVRQCREYLFVDFSEYAVARSLDCTLSDSLVLMQRHDPHDEYPYEESHESTKYNESIVHKY